MEQKIIEEVGKHEGRVKMKAKVLAKLQYCKRKINERMTTQRPLMNTDVYMKLNQWFLDYHNACSNDQRTTAGPDDAVDRDGKVFVVIH